MRSPKELPRCAGLRLGRRGQLRCPKFLFDRGLPAIRRSLAQPAAARIPGQLRTATTLIEVTIAAVILVTVMVMLFESMASSTAMSDLGSMEDELADDERQIVRTIEMDLSASGWHLADSIHADEVAAAVNPDVSDFLSFDPGENGWNHQDFYLGTASMTAAQKFANDRVRTYYPFIQTQTGLGLGNTVTSSYVNRQSWAYTQRASDYHTPGVLPSNVPPEYSGISREIFFLRTTIAGWSQYAWDQQQAATSFRGTTEEWIRASSLARTGGSASASPTEILSDKIAREKLDLLFISGWEPDPVNSGLVTFRRLSSGQYPNVDPLTGKPVYGNVLESGLIETSSNGSLLVKPKWETMALGTIVDPVTNVTRTRTPAENALPTNFRVYQYAVVPSSQGTDRESVTPERNYFGSLVRAFSVDFDDPSAPPNRGKGTSPGKWISYDEVTHRAMVVDKVLSDNVVRVLFNTFRHDSNLSVNQVSMVLYLAKRTAVDPQITRYRKVETVFHLGTRNGSSDLTYDAEALGSALPFPQ